MSEDIIYREDAIKAINARADWYQVTCNGKQVAVMLMAKDVNECLEKVPPADRPQGEWIPRYHQGVDKLICECSNCHTLHAITNYCPNCGSKMKGAEDE